MRVNNELEDKAQIARIVTTAPRPGPRHPRSCGERDLADMRARCQTLSLGRAEVVGRKADIGVNCRLPARQRN